MHTLRNGLGFLLLSKSRLNSVWQIKKEYALLNIRVWIQIPIVAIFWLLVVFIYTSVIIEVSHLITVEMIYTRERAFTGSLKGKYSVHVMS